MRLSDVRIHPSLALENGHQSFIQMSSLGVVSGIPNDHYSGGRCL
jgi:hypothetical protein